MPINKKLKEKIDKMSHVAMATAWRFTVVGDPLFQGEAYEYFKKKFDEAGGMTVAISREVGWDAHPKPSKEKKPLERTPT